MVSGIVFCWQHSMLLGLLAVLRAAEFEIQVILAHVLSGGIRNCFFRALNSGSGEALPQVRFRPSYRSPAFKMGYETW